MQESPGLKQALLDPTSVFDSPESVVHSDALSTAEKIEVLRRWAYDAREIAVAEEEGMTDGRGSLLHRVFQALSELGVDPDLEHSAPTKQSGV
jgi:hypothetical protein